jgi:hypothetical protein
MSKTFHFRVFLKCRKGMDEGTRQMAKCIVNEADEKAARLRVLDFVNWQNEPQIPDGATAEEVAHIEKHWNRWRLQNIEPLERPETPDDYDPRAVIYWWDWDELPATEG